MVAGRHREPAEQTSTERSQGDVARGGGLDLNLVEEFELKRLDMAKGIVNNAGDDRGAAHEADRPGSLPGKVISHKCNMENINFIAQKLNPALTRLLLRLATDGK